MPTVTLSFAKGHPHARSREGYRLEHINLRNDKSAIVRDLQLVIQCTATVTTYAYILGFVLDQAAGLHIDVRATGIVPTKPVRQGL